MANLLDNLQSRKELRVPENLAAHRVALLDAAGVPIPGFAMADGDPITSDSLRHALSWKGTSNISALRGREVALQFQIRGKAKLFAFR